MGKRKVDNLKYIENRNLRNISFHFRKRGLAKKAIEMASMCGLDVYLCIYDTDRNKVVEYQSSEEFDVHRVRQTIMNKQM